MHMKRKNGENARGASHVVTRTKERNMANGNVYPKVVIQMSDTVRIEASAPVSKSERDLLMAAIDGLQMNHQPKAATTVSPLRRGPGRPRKAQAKPTTTPVEA